MGEFLVDFTEVKQGFSFRKAANQILIWDCGDFWEVNIPVFCPSSGAMEREPAADIVLTRVVKQAGEFQLRGAIREELARVENRHWRSLPLFISREEGKVPAERF